MTGIVKYKENSMVSGETGNLKYTVRIIILLMVCKFGIKMIKEEGMILRLMELNLVVKILMEIKAKLSYMRDYGETGILGINLTIIKINMLLGIKLGLSLIKVGMMTQR